MESEPPLEPEAIFDPTLDEPDELDPIRRDFARRMLALHGIDDPRLEAAFATVRREHFLPCEKWTLLRPGEGTRTLAENDPAQLYQDVLVVLDRSRGVNNGSPALHALMLHRLGVRPGERVLHLGMGGGYYTAMLAELTGPEGTVTAVEHDRELAGFAYYRLYGWPNVKIHGGDGAGWPRTEVDRIYVNFAVPRPADAWLDHLADGGRLVFPLAVPPPSDPHALHGTGAVLAITRRGRAFAAAFVSPCGFVRAQGKLIGTAALRTGLHEAFQRGGVEFVASLRRGPSPPLRCWFWSREWSLSYDPPPEAAG